MVYEYLSSQFLSLKNHFNENEFSYFFFIRLIPGIPFPIKNVMPVLFNMRLKNFFLATFFGEALPTIITLSVISGFSNVIEESNSININILYDPQIFLPLLALGIMVIVTNFLKKKYYKK